MCKESGSPAEYHLTNLRRVMWAAWCWSSWVAGRHSTALESAKNSTHLSLCHCPASVRRLVSVGLLCFSSTALDLKSVKEKRSECPPGAPEQPGLGYIWPCQFAHRSAIVCNYAVSCLNTGYGSAVELGHRCSQRACQPVARPSEGDASFSWI